ncbi:hypothetical protein EZV62_000653 [Acer yangbiense]|uniref:DYW domain-containing protein n=1 Tax=Acer yangbiense TaxID=1000413 RepID=A0A5C7ITB2_9ROSI|nr:hypothetical protein EZV62_000653 [Acer yangbiense]
MFVKMRMEGLDVDRFSFPPLLKAAARVKGLVEGMQFHGLGAKLGFDLDPFVQTGLVGMYAACGRIGDARLMFDKMSHRDVVTWSIMFDGYCQSGLFDDVLKLFEEMRRSNVEPDEMVLSKILSACARSGNISYGKVIHEFIVDNNVVMDAHLQTALITMYASCGCLDMAKDLFDNMWPKNMVVSTAMISNYSRAGRIEDARLMFDQMVEKDLVSWSAMISGYAESDRPQEALKLFNEMQVLKMKPDQVTMLSVISACAHLGALDKAQWIHLYVDKYGFGGDLRVNNAIIDMYAKCGSLERAREVFDKMQRRNVISWTSMINSFAVHGDASNALAFFRKMKEEDIEPNGVTFVGVLYACSHSGLVEEGRKIFSSMINEHNITPKHEHYGCMVDLFGRANLLREALEVIETMPLAPNVVIWGSLMAACWVHGEIELGEFAAKQLLKLEPDHDGALVVLSNIYAKERRWQDVGELRKSMKRRGIAKERGSSRIEMKNEVQEFLMADRNHKQADRIYEKLDEVVSELKRVGYAPNTHCVLVDVEEDEKQEVVLWHSEKLALCYGLMSEPNGSCIRIVKNLRVCEDCHTFIKLVSKVYGREIVVRDRTRFHHYKDGVCSCKDYW